MVEIKVDTERVTVEVLGWDRLWSFKRRIEIPRYAIRRVRRLPEAAMHGVWKGWRIPGTHMPGVIVAGTYYKRGERQFWDVRHADHAIEIELEGESYDRLFVEVADPVAAVRALAPT